MTSTQGSPAPLDPHRPADRWPVDPPRLRLPANLTQPEWATDRAARLPVPFGRAALRPVGMRRRVKAASLLHDDAFRWFWIAKLASQTAQGALLYAFLLMVADRSDRALSNALFVACSIVPAILFGLPAGVAVDRLPRRPVLVGLNFARAIFAATLVVVDVSLAGIFAASLALWTMFQFFGPAESAALLDLTPRRRVTEGQSLSNFAGSLAQALGLVVLAPVLLKTVGPRPLFAVCAALLVIATGFNALLPRMAGHIVAPRREASLRSTLLDGWRGIQSDDVTRRALYCDVLIGIGMSGLVVIVPLYLRGVLDTAADNTAFVFAPAALGLVAGLRMAPALARRFGAGAATAGLLGFACCIAALGAIEPLREMLNAVVPFDQAADLARIPAPVLLAMLVSVPAGFCSALVSVTTRALLLTHTPPKGRGQTIATTTLLGNAGALAPTLLAGVAADHFGVERVAVGIAAALAIGA
ncbi:MAG TPA: MFS transporter, partial [Thermomicrobiales bacterium]|nr:MFS transporter [Thermomicrobiales bacterium]